MSTNQHTPHHPHPRQYSLTLAQRRAIELLLRGRNDREVAEELGVGRSTVARWRLRDPKFQLALDRRRAAIWPTANDLVRSLLPTALASMEEQLRVGPNRGRLTLDFVTRAGLLGKPYSGAIATAGIGPTSMADLLDREVLRYRAATRPPTTGDAEDGADPAPLPITDADRDAAYQRLMDRLAAPDPDEDDEDGDEQPAAPAAAAASSAPSVGAAPNGHAPTVSASTRTMSSFS